MAKFAAIVFCALVCFCVAVNGDTVVLRNVGKDIDLKVVGVTGEYLNAVISKKSLKSLNMQFLNPGNYPDMISLDIANVAVECKIKEITEDAIHVLIPTSKISSLQMFFRSDGKQTVTSPVEIDNRPKATEVVEEKETSESNQNLLKESLDKEEVGKAVEEDIKKEEPGIHDRNLGSVEGKILRSGNPLYPPPGTGRTKAKGGHLTTW